MSDIIDSLKRLERIGSENSKTVEKIIEAAKEISYKIVSSYAPGLDGFIRLPRIYVRDGPAGELSDEFGFERARFQDYAITGGCLCFERGNWPAVYHNRELALQFASDIANGLLDVVAEDLEKRQAENVSTLEKLRLAQKK